LTECQFPAYSVLKQIRIGGGGRFVNFYPDGQLIAVLAASRKPNQTMHNVKIMFINFDFLKMNKYE